VPSVGSLRLARGLGRVLLKLCLETSRDSSFQRPIHSFEAFLSKAQLFLKRAFSYYSFERHSYDRDQLKEAIP
jgi:hypothetical protein